MEFLQANWVWLLLVTGALWLLFRGGLGCMGRRESSDRRRRAERDLESPEVRPDEGASPENASCGVEHAGHRRHRGC